MTAPPIVHGLRVDHLELPAFRLVEQRFAVPPAIDVPVTLAKEWRRLRDAVRLTPRDEIAVAVGSRGIDCLSEIVRGVVGKLREAGCRPFIVPAMGSHGEQAPRVSWPCWQSKGSARSEWVRRSARPWKWSRSAKSMACHCSLTG